MAALNAERSVHPRIAPANPVSPLVRILQDGVEAGLVVKDSEASIYTGFLQWQHVKASNCRFEAMNSNRAINDSVVEARFKENLEELAAHDRFKDFGQINLLILLNDPQHVFYVMDGQHRCRVMERLHRHTNRDIKFQFRAKAVSDEAEAHRELIHFQNAYPSDPRAFFSNKRARQVGTSVLQRLRTKFSSQDLWMDVTTFRSGKRTGDPNRPKLNDFLIFWLLQDSQLLSSSENDVQVFERLLKMNAVMQRIANDERAKLGKGVTENMVRSAQRWGCFLGFFRVDQLRWYELADRLAAPGNPEEEREARESVSCVICLAASRSILFRPCRHVCCCSACAENLDRCPVCREPAELKENVYVP